MTARELEQKLDISQDVLCFYEKNGFVQPEKAGFQKSYAKEDVQTLKKLVLLQRLGIPYEEIEALYDGEKILADVVSEQKEAVENDHTYRGVRRICDMIEQENDFIDSMDVDRYWDVMEALKDKGHQFFEQDKEEAFRKNTIKKLCYGIFTPFLMIIMALFMRNVSINDLMKSGTSVSNCEIVYAQSETANSDYLLSETENPYFSKVWANTDPLKRYLLLDQLFNSYELIGMSVTEVEEELGLYDICKGSSDEENAYADEIWAYEVKYDAEGIKCFVLYFKDGVVSHYKMTYFSEL